MTGVGSQGNAPPGRHRATEGTPPPPSLDTSAPTWRPPSSFPGSGQPRDPLPCHMTPLPFITWRGGQAAAPLAPPAGRSSICPTAPRPPSASVLPEARHHQVTGSWLGKRRGRTGLAGRQGQNRRRAPGPGECQRASERAARADRNVPFSLLSPFPSPPALSGPGRGGHRRMRGGPPHPPQGPARGLQQWGCHCPTGGCVCV